ncbi:MAG: helix-turn-helix domain-containing protein [Oscillospiraceae bacterium]|jgi:excisionase family DNA binding protein
MYTGGCQQNAEQTGLPANKNVDAAGQENRKCGFKNFLPYTTRDYGVPNSIFSRQQNTERKMLRGHVMKESAYKNYEDLLLFLNANRVSKVLGVSISTAYELMHEKDFPALRIGCRMVVPKKDFIAWVAQHTGGGAR